MGTVGNVKIEPMVATWGTDTAMVQTITCVADVADSLDGNYFFLYNSAGTKFHVWYNTSGGSATDPAPAGSTAAVVAITTGATANAVATATELVIEALTGFDSTVSANVITVTQTTVGYAPIGHDVDSGFTIALVTEGDTAADIGFVDGDMELSISEDLVDVTAHETGSNVLTQIRTGKQVEVTLTFKETSVAQMKKILRQAGGAFTPVGANSTEVVGAGTHKDFTQTLDQAKKLVLHPKVLGTSDRTRDYTFHSVYPMLDTIAFSGENLHLVPVTFKAYPKTTLNDRVEYYSYGDGTQTLT
jgi:hypothetical protein